MKVLGGQLRNNFDCMGGDLALVGRHRELSAFSMILKHGPNLAGPAGPIKPSLFDGLKITLRWRLSA